MCSELQRRGLIKGMNTGQKWGQREDGERKWPWKRKGGEKHVAAYIVCSADVRACFQTRIHAFSCHAMSSCQDAGGQAAMLSSLNSRDRLLSQDHRLGTPHPIVLHPHLWRSSLFIYFSTSYEKMYRGGDRGRGRGGPDRGRGSRGARGGPPGGRGRGGYVTFTFLCYSNSWLVSIFAEGQPAVIDSRLSNSAEDRLISSFKSLSLRQDARPPRPDYGSKG